MKWKETAPEDLLKLTPLEGNAWLLFYNLICEPKCRERYELTDHRRNSMSRLRKYINEILVDQLPMLADVQRYPFLYFSVSRFFFPMLHSSFVCLSVSPLLSPICFFLSLFLLSWPLCYSVSFLPFMDGFPSSPPRILLWVPIFFPSTILAGSTGLTLPLSHCKGTWTN